MAWTLSARDIPNNAEEYAYTFTTTFGMSSPSATNQEAQATSGDSGGGVFEQIGGTWYLVGLIDGKRTTPIDGDNRRQCHIIIDEKSP